MPAMPQMPPKSRMGNRITSGVLRLFFGMKIQDTQTGLRAFPRKYLETVLKAEGERYEYETNMLFVINKYKIPLEQVEIETVYIDENKSSHFRVVRDSLRVYGLILKYLCSSVGASLVDVFAYYILKRLAWLAFLPVPLTFSCAFLARVISSLFNYFINAKVVFKGKTGGRTIVRYYALAVLQIGVSALAVFGMEHVLHITTPGLSTVLKAIVDTILFFISFRVQHKWVFKEEQ